MFTFTVHPAYITVTDGIQTAWRFLGASWKRWLPVVLIVAAVEFAISAFMIGDTSEWYYVDRYTGKLVWNPDMTDRIGPLVVAFIGLFLVGLVAGWLFTGIAIAGLRNRPPAVSWIVRRGLLQLWSQTLVAIAAVAAAFVGLLALVVMARVAWPLAIVALLAAWVAAIVVSIRLAFSGLAIFDGCGPIEGLIESWHLSQQSVMRLIGWGLMAILITLGFGIVATIVSAPSSGSSLAPVGQAASTVVTTTATCFTTFFLAVLYESQRARHDPNLYPIRAATYPPGPYAPGWYPAGPYAPGWYPAGPYAPGPYPPGAPYPAAPYPPGPYPAGPYAPGWYPAGPYAPGPYPPGAPYPAAPYPPGPYQPDPSASGPYPPGPGWEANANPDAGPAGKPSDPDVGPAPADNPTPPDPPASS